jgi:hypothetical protein
MKNDLGLANNLDETARRIGIRGCFAAPYANSPKKPMKNIEEAPPG